jgi:ribosomal-protein-alanine N-acetyltransferase
MVHRFRLATPRDRDAVFALCASTWPDGDYIPRVWDAWLADPAGAFVVGVDATDTALAIGKLSVVAPGEGWIEGVRVAPAQRARGWGRALVAHLLACAQQQGLQVVRFLTAAGNVPMHRVAAALGFIPQGHYLPCHAAAEGAQPARLAQPDDTAALWALARQLPSPAEPLRWQGWRAAHATPAWLAAAVQAGHVLVSADAKAFAAVAPPAVPAGGEATVALLAGAPAAFPPLLAAVRAWAAAHGAARVLGLFPGAAAEAARQDGWTPYTEHPMWLYTWNREASSRSAAGGPPPATG